MFIIIDIYSKNSSVLINFVQKFFNKTFCTKLKLTILSTKIQKVKIKKILTVLKSPHVNKTAQEHFEQKMYKKQIKCFTFQILLFLIFLKQIKFFFVSDINIKINIVKNIKKSNKKIKNIFDVDNYSLNYDYFKIFNYLTCFETSGEFILKSKSCLDSSVG